MAQAWIAHFGKDKLQVYSAGLDPKEVNEKAIKVMQESGIDIKTKI